MVTRITSLENIEQTIFSNIIKSISKYISKEIFNNENIFINYSGFDKLDETTTSKEVRSSIEKHEMLDVDFTYDLIDTRTHNINAVNLVKPILLNNNIEFRVTPNLSTYRFTITFKFRSKSKNRVLKVLNYYKRVDRVYQVPIYYHYLLPKNLLSLLSSISRTRCVVRRGTTV